MTSIDRSYAKKIVASFGQFTAPHSPTYLTKEGKEVLDLSQRRHKASFGEVMGLVDTVLNNQDKFSGSELEFVQRGFRQIKIGFETKERGFFTSLLCMVCVTIQSLRAGWRLNRLQEAKEKKDPIYLSRDTAERRLASIGSYALYREPNGEQERIKFLLKGPGNVIIEQDISDREQIWETIQPCFSQASQLDYLRNHDSTSVFTDLETAHATLKQKPCSAWGIVALNNQVHIVMRLPGDQGFFEYVLNPQDSLFSKIEEFTSSQGKREILKQKRLLFDQFTDAETRLERHPVCAYLVKEKREPSTGRSKAPKPLTLVQKISKEYGKASYRHFSLSPNQDLFTQVDTFLSGESQFQLIPGHTASSRQEAETKLQPATAGAYFVFKEEEKYFFMQKKPQGGLRLEEITTPYSLLRVVQEKTSQKGEYEALEGHLRISRSDYAPNALKDKPIGAYVVREGNSNNYFEIHQKVNANQQACVVTYVAGTSDLFETIEHTLSEQWTALKKGDFVDDDGRKGAEFHFKFGEKIENCRVWTKKPTSKNIHFLQRVSSVLYREGKIPKTADFFATLESYVSLERRLKNDLEPFRENVVQTRQQAMERIQEASNGTYCIFRDNAETFIFLQKQFDGTIREEKILVSSTLDLKRTMRAFLSAATQFDVLPSHCKAKDKADAEKRLQERPLGSYIIYKQEDKGNGYYGVLVKTPAHNHHEQISPEDDFSTKILAISTSEFQWEILQRQGYVFATERKVKEHLAYFPLGSYGFYKSYNRELKIYPIHFVQRIAENTYREEITYLSANLFETIESLNTLPSLLKALKIECKENADEAEKALRYKEAGGCVAFRSSEGYFFLLQKFPDNNVTRELIPVTEENLFPFFAKRLNSPVSSVKTDSPSPASDTAQPVQQPQTSSRVIFDSIKAAQAFLSKQKAGTHALAKNEKGEEIFVQKKPDGTYREEPFPTTEDEKKAISELKTHKKEMTALDPAYLVTNREEIGKRLESQPVGSYVLLQADSGYIVYTQKICDDIQRSELIFSRDDLYEKIEFFNSFQGQLEALKKLSNCLFVEDFREIERGQYDEKETNTPLAIGGVGSPPTSVNIYIKHNDKWQKFLEVSHTENLFVQVESVLERLTIFKTLNMLTRAKEVFLDYHNQLVKPTPLKKAEETSLVQALGIYKEGAKALHTDRAHKIVKEKFPTITNEEEQKKKAEEIKEQLTELFKKYSNVWEIFKRAASTLHLALFDKEVAINQASLEQMDKEIQRLFPAKK